MGLILIMLPFAAGILWLAYKAAESVDREDFRMRLLRRWDELRIDTRAKMNNEDLQRLLTESGLPISIQAFQAVRWSLIFVLVFVGANKAFAAHKIIFLGLPLLGYIITRYQSPFPIYYALRALHASHIRNLNKELFNFFNSLLQSFADHQETPVTLYQTMKDIQPSLNELAEPLMRCINKMPRDPDEALDGLASELGTEVAQELVGLLKQIQKSTPDVALDVLEKRYEHFQKKRIADVKRNNWVRSNIGYTVTYGGIAIVGITIVATMLTYATHLNNLALQTP